MSNLLNTIPEYSNTLPQFKWLTKKMKHIPYHLIKIGTDVFVEEKNNPKIMKANVRDIYDFGVALQTEEEDGVVYMKKDFGFTWKLWYGYPNEKERKSDTWRI